jgi:hypothetical protein
MTHNLTSKTAYKGQRKLFSAYTANGALKNFRVTENKEGSVSTLQRKAVFLDARQRPLRVSLISSISNTCNTALLIIFMDLGLP